MILSASHPRPADSKSWIGRIAIPIVVIVAACGNATPAADGGVEGRVTVGPTCPVVREGTECPDQPFQAVLKVTDPEGREVAKGKSDAAGLFRIALPPGDYVLVPESPSGTVPPFAAPIEFQVDAGAWTRLEVSFDSGIR